MTMTKVVLLQIKAAGPADGLEEGQFIGYASIFGNIDSYGDKVMPGAFTDTLADWESKAASAVIPLLYGHDMSDPNNNVGWAMEAVEDGRGLRVKCQIDLDGGNGPQVYRLIKGRRLSQMSFAYDVESGGWAKDGEEEFFELRKLKLYEVSLVPVGANQETELIAVKSAAEHAIRFVQNIKAGRVLSAKNENALKDAQTQIAEASQMLAEVLASVEDAGAQEGEKASEEHPAKSEELPADPPAVKLEEPSVKSSADSFLSLIEVYRKEL